MTSGNRQSEPGELPEPVELQPALAGGSILTTDRFPDEVAQLIAEFLTLLVGRASTTAARRAAALQILTAARRMASQHGLDVRPALPALDDLVEVQRHAALVTHHSRVERPDLPDFEIRTTLVRVAGTGLLLTLITGSGALMDTEFVQPAAATFAAVIERYGPALTVASELMRVGKDPWALAPVVHAFRRIEPRLGATPWLAGDDDDDRGRETMFLERVTHRTEDRLYRAGRQGQVENQRIQRRTTDGARSRAEEHRVFIDGWAPWFAGGAVTPGLFTVRGFADPTNEDPLHSPTESVWKPGEHDARHYPSDLSTEAWAPGGQPGPRGLIRRFGRGDPRVYVDAPWARPAADMVWGTLPQVYDDDGQPVDQWATLEWLLGAWGEKDWTDAHVIGRELERRRWSHDGIRNMYGPAATYVAGGTRDYKELQLIRRHLDDYWLRRIVERLGDGKDEIIVTGLPRALSEASYHRILRLYPQTRARRDTHLFTSAPVHLVDDDKDGVLKGRVRRRDGTITYPLCEPDGRRRLGGRNNPVPPPSQADLVWPMLETLAAENATFTAPSSELPEELVRLKADIAQAEQDIEKLTIAQRARLEALDPGNPNRPGPRLATNFRDRYERDAERLTDLADAVAQNQALLRSREEDLNMRGIPVADLWSLAAAVVGDGRGTPQWLRPVILAALDGAIQVRRPVGGNGALPDKPPWLGFWFWFHDPEVGARRAWAEGSYATAWQRHGSDRVQRILANLAAGQTIAQQRIDLREHGPALRRGLGEQRPARVLCMDDPELVEKTMAVCYQLLDPSEVPPGGRLTGPPLDDPEVATLAAEMGWQEPLLLRIRSLHLHGTRTTARVLHLPAPATAALYAAARRRPSIPVTAAEAALLSTRRTDIDWTVGSGRAALIPCASCGSRGIRLSRLMEVTGGKCGKCGRDRANVWWPGRYDRYLEP